MKNNDYVICIRRGGGAYTVYDLEGELEANGHKHALQRYLLALGTRGEPRRSAPSEGHRRPRSKGDRERVLKADVAVYRKASETTYRAFFDLHPKQFPYPLTNELCGKQHARKSAPCENEKRGTAAQHQYTNYTSRGRQDE